MRVIAGRLGGRRLTAPRGASTRPTTDRVREALFSVLGDLSGAKVADLFAGTGALGIEALSRGAARAVFVENGRPALAALRQNLTTLGLDAVARVVALPLARAAAVLGAEAPFDLVLADPPYAALAEACKLLDRLAGSALLAPGGRLVLEHAARDDLPPLEHLVLLERRSYGDTALAIHGPTPGRQPTVAT